MKGAVDSIGRPAEHVTVRVASLDRFIAANGLSRIDYIKSDIEGDERSILRGARETMQRDAPRLALSSYHLPDDPQVMEAGIRTANPDYRIHNFADKLYGWVENTR